MICSMIIVSYNEDKYIREAIESCLAQDIPDNKDIEIIIGDDGSTDRSIETIQVYCNKYPQIVKYFVMDRSDVTKDNIIPSIRVSNLLKKAFEQARGEYLQVLSADDVLTEKTKLADAICFLEQNKDYSCCYSDYKKFGKTKDEIIHYDSEKSFSKGVLWSYEYRHISCFVFRRNVLSNLLNRICDDIGLVYSGLISGKIKHDPLVGFGYRQRESGIAATTNEMNWHLVDLLLYQDISRIGKMSFSSLARFYDALIYVFRNRAALASTEYRRYQDVGGDKYGNDYIAMISDFDAGGISRKLRIFLLLAEATVSKMVYKIIYELEKLYILK